MRYFNENYYFDVNPYLNLKEFLQFCNTNT